MRAALLIVVVCVLTACGFKLRGQVELPAEMARTELDIRPKYGGLARELRHALNAQDVTLVESGGTARMRFQENRFERNIASINEGARVREIELRYRVRFDVVSDGGDRLVPEQDLELTRQLTFDESQGLGVEQEIELLEQQLINDMVNLILLRINTVTQTS